MKIAIAVGGAVISGSVPPCHIYTRLGELESIRRKRREDRRE
ncbi:MAG: hypothetical protein OEZ21_02730 [Candidatus Bathyarchaeota archaeon]|nr:hypothetical protein [Candidatus Bathyarchaeota archaeon]MDH5745862.1 hypothetical protein [Candidatus Bathyarchaeota archaeon]